MSKLAQRLAVIGATGLAVLGMLTACSPNSSGNADSTPEKAPKGSSDTQTADQKFQEWQLKFAQCMRAEGIDMPDPTEGGQAMTAPRDMDAFQKAGTKCQSELGDPPSRDGKSAEQVREEGLKFAQCVRDAGYRMKDPEPGPGAKEIPAGVPEDVLKKCSQA